MSGCSIEIKVLFNARHKVGIANLKKRKKRVISQESLKAPTKKKLTKMLLTRKCYDDAKLVCFISWLGFYLHFSLYSQKLCSHVSFMVKNKKNHLHHG
jgi:hypothetical protein